MIRVEPELLERAVAGDSSALTQLVSTLQGPFFGLARRVVLEPSDAEDATQEALLRVVTHLSQFRAEARFSTWAWRIAANTFLEFRGRRATRDMMSLEAFQADLREGLEPEAPEHADDALRLEQLKLGCGLALFHTLDAEHRLAYVLGEIVALDGGAAAEVLGLEPATFRKRLSRAREHLRDALGRTCGIVEPRNPCRCHRRLSRARQLGRVTGAPGEGCEVDLPTLRERIARLDVLERAAAFYRADPAPRPSRDLVDAVHAALALRSPRRGPGADV